MRNGINLFKLFFRSKQQQQIKQSYESNVEHFFIMNIEHTNSEKCKKLLRNPTFRLKVEG